MHATAAATYLHGMLQVQHLVVKEILHGVTGSVLAVKDSADHDRVVRWIIVTQTALGHVPTPGEQRPAHQPVKKSAVQAFKNFIQIVVLTLRPQHLLAAPGLPDQLGLPNYRFTGSKPAITSGL